MERIPQISSVHAVGAAMLRVAFRDGSQRLYDCAPLLERPEFQPLKTLAFFRAVTVDPGGYGISWNDDIDLSEYELWTNGRPVAVSPPRQATDR
jgi:hypothetical protein